MQREIVPIILAGGEGRRLRPLTAPGRPKPFLKLFSKYSLLQMTLERGKNFMPPVIVCAARFAGTADSEAKEIGVKATVIAEPTQRGTAAAIASAAFMLERDNPVMLVMPSDHVITDHKIFRETVERAVALVRDVPVILGKIPDGPGQRYGHIRTREENGSFLLESFTEKPPAKVADVLAKMPGVFWNTGIFLCRARALLDLLTAHAPEIYESARQAVARARREDNILHPDASRYEAIPTRSIDHAMMERLQGGVVLPLETGWHDVGCWERFLALKLGSVARRLDFSRRHEPERQRQ